jgi:tuberous sclerosis protein 2
MRNLAALLSRDAVATPIKPPLSEILLSIADHLSDLDTALLPSLMSNQQALSPTNPDWTKNWHLLLATPALHDEGRRETRRTIFEQLEGLYGVLTDMPEYRFQLGDLTYDYIKQHTERHHQGSHEAAWRVLSEEIVWRSSDIEHGPILYDHEGEVVVDNIHPDVDVLLSFLADSACGTFAHNITELSMSPASTITALSSSSSLSLKASGVQFMQTSLDAAVSFVNVGPRPTEPSATASPQTDTSPSSVKSLSVLATATLISAFSSLVFTSRSLGEHNLVVAVRIFKELLSIAIRASDARARLCALQFLLRLRADREHRLHYGGETASHDPYIRALAMQINRCEAPPVPSAPPTAEPMKYRGRGMKPSKVEPPSRSRSRAPRPPSKVPQAPYNALWRLPDELLYQLVEAQTFSERLTSYDPAGPGRKVVLPLSDYLDLIIQILAEEHDWEIMSYLLCHLPTQLSNKHLMCGPKCREKVIQLFNTIQSGISTNTFASYVGWPEGVHDSDAVGLAYNTMIVLVSYRSYLDLKSQHSIVEIFHRGLSGPPAAQQCCLHGLTLCAYEMPKAVTRDLNNILDRLTQIMSSPQMPVNIMNFLHIVGCIPELYFNFTQENFKKVFAVTTRYLQDFKRNSLTPGQSWAIAQHVRIMSFATLYVWFLAVQLPDRPAHISDITRGLLEANEGNDHVDEPTEVCFDWLARYTYGNADPRPAGSALDATVMRPTAERTTTSSSKLAFLEKTWLMGDTSVLTMKALPKAGWVEITSRRPCGLTKVLSRMDNVPLIGPGDVDPDMFSIPGILMMDKAGDEVPGEVYAAAERQNEEVGSLSRVLSLYCVRACTHSIIRPVQVHRTRLLRVLTPFRDIFGVEPPHHKGART